MTSQFKTMFLLALLSGLIIVLGGAVGGRGGIMIALAFALVMNIGSYWYSDKIVLSMYRARELSPQEAPMLHQMVEELAGNAGVPKPRVYLVPQEAPNAFATGRNPQNSAVAVTEGIMRLLSPPLPSRPLPTSRSLPPFSAEEAATAKSGAILWPCCSWPCLRPWPQG